MDCLGHGGGHVTDGYGVFHYWRNSGQRLRVQLKFLAGGGCRLHYCHIRSDIQTLNPHKILVRNFAMGHLIDLPGIIPRIYMDLQLHIQQLRLRCRFHRMDLCLMLFRRPLFSMHDPVCGWGCGICGF